MKSKIFFIVLGLCLSQTALAQTPAQCRDSILSSARQIETLIKGTGDQAIIRYVMGGRPSDFNAIDQRGMDRFKSLGDRLKSHAVACKSACHRNPNAQLKQICQKAQGMANGGIFGQMNTKSFIETYQGITGLRGHVESAYRTRTSNVNQRYDSDIPDGTPTSI